MRQYRIFLPAVLAALAAGRPVARAQSPAATPGERPTRAHATWKAAPGAGRPSPKIGSARGAIIA